ncbi:MAG: C25 family cysteine peptidase, partial [Bacteroidales bacterium]
MKNTTLTSFQKASSILKTILIILMTFGILSLKAGDITVKTGNADLKVKQNTNTKLQLSNSFTKFTYRDVKTNKGMFTQLSIPDYGTSNRIGDPQLPMLRKLIEIPLGANVNVNVISYTLTEYNLSDYDISNKIIPSQPPVSKDIKKKLPDFEYNTATYNADQFNTDDLVSVDILGIMRGVRLARLNIAPVRYNPVTNTIQVYNDIEVEVTFPGADVAQTIELKKKTGSMYFESMYNNALLNYKKAHSTKDTVTKYPVKYVIVSDPAFQSALQPFVQWKTKKGFTVIEAYTNNPAVGTTTTLIKNYLQGLYNAGTPSDPAPSFVLFVGDVAQVPSFNGTTGSHVSDLYYCEYTGDFFPEVYYGRFSATNLTELQPQIDKTLEYEQYLMQDPSFLGQVVMISGQDDTYGPLQGDGQINYGTSTYFNTAHNLTSHTYLYAVSGSSAAQIIQNISDGVGFANYTAHGDWDGWDNPSFTISDIAGLQNAHKYPLMIGNACLTNKFDKPECFGEALLRANNKGALGYIGGSNNTTWDEDYWWAVGYKTIVVNPVYNDSSLGAYDRTFHDHGEPFGEWYATQDQMIFAGNLAVTQSGSSSDYYWEIYHLMGDPSLMVYFGIPPALTINHLPFIPLNTDTFIVNTEPYTYVAISSGGVLHGVALADSTGYAKVQIVPFTVSSTADIVATRQNRAPYINSVLAYNPTTPYVMYVSKQLHDAAGNNNGLADYGESITLDITLQNVGGATANGVSAKLRSTDSYITLTDTTQSWGNITNGFTSTQNNAYAFTVANLVPDQHIVPFTLVITDNSSNTWTETFNIVLNALALSIGNITINDATGNGNGRLDPGETVDIIITSANTGHADASNTTSNLTLTGGSVAINTGTSNLGTLVSLTGSANATFNITVSPLAVIGSVAYFNNTLSSGLYSVQKPIGLFIGPA